VPSAWSSDRKAGAAGHHRFGANGNLTREVVGIVVDPCNCLHTLERSGSHHGLRTFTNLFSWLEYQVNSALQ
jgi:hypothetical protein